MSDGRAVSNPRTFFLNEQHELARIEKEGGGGTPQYAPIDWNAKSDRLRRTLRRTVERTSSSRDPLRDKKYYLVALPAQNVEKLSSNVRKHPTGRFVEETDYSSAPHSLVFRRLGLDLIDVVSAGTAVVHATKSRVERLLATTKELHQQGVRQQSRWMTIDSFGAIPPSLRVDAAWINALSSTELVDAVVHLQPLLSRMEFDDVLRALAQVLGSKGGAFTGNGTDFSGRYWLRGRLRRDVIKTIADDFFSVQSIHAPLRCAVDGTARGGRQAATGIANPFSMMRPASELPCVAVVDTGVPLNHLKLARYRRPGGYRDPDAPFEYMGDHGSLVASRVVFGDLDATHLSTLPPGTCSFMDVVVALDHETINEEGVMAALQAILGTSPDVRVFNISFGGYASVAGLDDVQRRERLLFAQHLDNFVFARDVLVVVAAGNSVPGVLPASPYPGHFDDPNWALGTWASGFNTLTCGAAVERLSPDAVVANLGCPSPFTRVGPAFPGHCEAPVPEFAAHGGNGNAAYTKGPHQGVWGFTAAGDFEDRSGTSFAAPLLAREAALAFAELQPVCASGTRPYAATVKAFLALNAKEYDPPRAVHALARRTLGYGRASAARLRAPSAASAVLVWQGLLDGPDDMIRVQVPVPRAWLQEAERPTMRICCAWDTPVHSALLNVWGCRRVSGQLRPAVGAEALTGSQGGHGSHPLWLRTFALDAERLRTKKVRVNSDMWLLELSYSQIAEYYPGTEFSPKQRVGVAIELVDDSEQPASPQRALQALPIAQTLVRLSASAIPIVNPISVRVP